MPNWRRAAGSAPASSFPVIRSRLPPPLQGTEQGLSIGAVHRPLAYESDLLTRALRAVGAPSGRICDADRSRPAAWWLT
jgi:hypothetical protein